MRTVVLAIVFACALVPSADAEEPVATPTAGLALSTKPMPGCCCYPHLQKPGEWGCAWGMQEEKCKDLGIYLKMPHKWTPERCPAPK